MSSRTVTTMEELKRAKEENIDTIVVEGKLAKNLAKSKKLSTLTASSLAILTAAITVTTIGIIAAPSTGGISTIAVPVSFAAAAPIATSTGLSISTIKFLFSVGISGLTIILSILNGYTMEIDLKSLRVILTQK